jgi:hypothetical protein
MRRTRKWSFVAQEAKRLADLGLSGYAIAKRLEVSEASVSRWVKAGKLVLKGGKRDQRRSEIAALGATKSPAEWAAAVRADYSLDATDDQFVTLAEAALAKALNPRVKLTARLQAMRTFQGLVKQLALVAKAADAMPAPAATPEPPKRQTFPVQRRRIGDPREILTMVKS